MRVLAILLLLSLPACLVAEPTPAAPPPQAYASVRSDWVYYPDHEVYYRASGNEWAYRNGDRWVTEARPPPRIAVPSAEVSVRLDFRGDRPYEHHDEHATAYPRGYRPRRE
jgi:hypothetical protein